MQRTISLKAANIFPNLPSAAVARSLHWESGRNEPDVRESAHARHPYSSSHGLVLGHLSGTCDARPSKHFQDTTGWLGMFFEIWAPLRQAFEFDLYCCLAHGTLFCTIACRRHVRRCSLHDMTREF